MHNDTGHDYGSTYHVEHIELWNKNEMKWKWDKWKWDEMKMKWNEWMTPEYTQDTGKEYKGNKSHRDNIKKTTSQKLQYSVNNSSKAII